MGVNQRMEDPLPSNNDPNLHVVRALLNAQMHVTVRRVRILYIEFAIFSMESPKLDNKFRNCAGGAYLCCHLISNCASKTSYNADIFGKK